MTGDELSYSVILPNWPKRRHTVKLSAEENAKLGATASKLEFEDMDANNDGKVPGSNSSQFLASN